ncbi:MAG: response regulator transcription factor [Pseudobutyrivibrio sp.]|uniref:LytR/AlgR family response regulator transcription factor n=1 Tax=Pseudobutyrivibrio sp. TaxID=2014367 RepID=UPI0025E2EF58|nr:LytTR family DNA-binding domain-containing protein [Pseudobutyrivibrio sp.]MBQ8490469.1 response regulator transcription factor [Pseudobutyrivibrio sp.]
MKIAIIDDSVTDANVLKGYLHQYSEKSGKEFNIDYYEASIDFLEEFHNHYDVLFLDIEMPGSDGLTVAREIRKKDSSVAIVFVTNMAQFAIEGYKVNAVDFIVKPVGYFVFTDTLEKAINSVSQRPDTSVLINDPDGLYKINSNEILYIEKSQDKVIFHTMSRDYIERNTIKSIKEKLGNKFFGECSSGILVNYEQVRCITKEEVDVGIAKLPLSRRQKKQFTEDYIKYVGGY